MAIQCKIPPEEPGYLGSPPVPHCTYIVPQTSNPARAASGLMRCDLDPFYIYDNVLYHISKEMPCLT